MIIYLKLFNIMKYNIFSYKSICISEKIILTYYKYNNTNKFIFLIYSIKIKIYF